MLSRSARVPVADRPIGRSFRVGSGMAGSSALAKATGCATGARPSTRGVGGRANPPQAERASRTCKLGCRPPPVEFAVHRPQTGVPAVRKNPALPDPDIHEAALTAIGAFRARGKTVATAESCTGGLICGALTAIPGSSDVVLGGIVAYANRIKTALLGVPAPVIAEHGAVSAPVAAAMAEGARAALAADIAVAVTGVAGPGGGTAEKPVGLVWFGLATAGGTVTRSERFDGDRDAVRRATVLVALAMLAGSP